MNSILQTLLHCSRFRSFFLEFLRTTVVDKNQLDDDISSTSAVAGVGNLCVGLKQQDTISLKENTKQHKTPPTPKLCEVLYSLLRVL